MASTQLSPLHHNVPIVDPETGNPTPFFQQMIQQLLNEKGVTDDLADGAIQPGTVTTSGLTAAAQRLLGNKESTAGAIEELTLSQALDLIGSASHGDLLFRGAAGWQRLPAGTAGQFLKTLGAGFDPAWDSGGGGGGGSAPWYLANAPTVASVTSVTGDATSPTLTDDSDVGLRIDAGTPVSGDKFRGVEKTIASPASDWTWTVRLEALIPGVNYSSAVIWCRDSVSGKLLILGMDQTAAFNVYRYNALSGTFASSAMAGLKMAMHPAYWLRIKYIASSDTIEFYLSPLGKTFTKVATEARSTFLTNKPDRVGIGAVYNRTTSINNIMGVGYAVLA
jgi:hypothetical protein